MKIPKGWRKLKVREKVIEGDKFIDVDGFIFCCFSTVGERANKLEQKTAPYIRKIKK